MLIEKIVEEFNSTVQFVLVTTISSACPVNFRYEEKK
jgi:hypothetical protein